VLLFKSPSPNPSVTSSTQLSMGHSLLSMPQTLPAVKAPGSQLARLALEVGDPSIRSHSSARSSPSPQTSWALAPWVLPPQGRGPSFPFLAFLRTPLCPPPSDFLPFPAPSSRSRGRLGHRRGRGARARYDGIILILPQGLNGDRGSAPAVALAAGTHAGVRGLQSETRVCLVLRRVRHPMPRSRASSAASRVPGPEPCRKARHSRRIKSRSPGTVKVYSVRRRSLGTLAVGFKALGVDPGGAGVCCGSSDRRLRAAAGTPWL